MCIRIETTADGAAGARRAAALLGVAVCAEMANTTMDNEGAKIDLKVAFRHAFQLGKALTVHCQVKSGAAYKATGCTKDLLRINFGRETIEALSKGTGPGLLVWVPPKPSQRVYWHIIDPRRTAKHPVEIPRHQHITPFLRYALTRATEYASFNHGHAQQDVRIVPEELIQERARETYRAFQQRAFHHPLVGNLHVTRHAWRHVTRRSKVTRERLAGLRVVPYLQRFFETCPDRVDSSNPLFRLEGNRVDETRFILCWYKRALRMHGNSFALLIRVREIVSYPEDWLSYPLGVREVKHNATLESWWFKQEN